MVKEDKKRVPSLYNRFLFSGTAAIIAEFCTFPLDTTKIRMQIQIFSKDRFRKRSERWNRRTYGMFQLVKNIFKNEGIQGYYKGASFAMFRAFLNNSMSLSFYHPILHIVKGDSPSEAFSLKFYNSLSVKEKSEISLMKRLISASISGMITTILACPIDVVKVRMQADGHLKNPRYKTPLDALIKISKHGIFKFWTGLTPSLNRGAISVGVTLATYDHTKSLLRYRFKVKDNFFTHAFCGLISGVCTTICTCPLDVVKTRLQFQSMSTPKYKNVLSCFTKILSQEGPTALYHGFIPLLARLTPWQIIFFCSYEFISKNFTGITF